MKASLNNSRHEIPWQATVPSLLLNIRDKLLAANEKPGIIPQRSQKVLTREAIYVIYVMLAFILLAILGSLVTVYEFLLKDNGKKIKSVRIACERKSVKRVTRLKKKKESFKCQTFLEDIKSFLKFFCIITNGRRILNTVSTEDQIDCIQGLRFVGNAWVILTHIGISYTCILRDVNQLKPVFQWTTSQILLNGIFSVDIFFVISGFLNAYFFSHAYKKRKGKICWVFFYLKRIVRLTPVYMIVLGFYTTLFTYTGTGIVWPTYDTNPVCRKDWWWYLLYINNFEDPKMECLAWYWSFAADMQFYLISPLFMISLMKWSRFGYFLVFSCIAGSCTSSFVLTYQFNLIDGPSSIVRHLANFQHFVIKNREYFDTVYTKPYTRICTYLVGLILGYYLYKRDIKKDVIRNSKVTLYFGWITTACFMWICFCWLHGREEVLSMDTAFYNGTKDLFFCCGMAWIIYVCLTGQAEFLNSCLSWRAFRPLSRLSFCASLIHPIILLRKVQQTEDVVDYSAMSLASLYLYTLIITYPISFIVSILFEIPVINILDWLRKRHEDETSRLTASVCRTNPQNRSVIYKIS